MRSVRFWGRERSWERAWKRFFCSCECERENVKATRSSLTLCDLKDGSPQGSFVHGILQARVLEWIAVVVLVTQSCPTLCNPWTVAHQASLSMEFSRQEYWSGLPFPSPEDLPNPGIEPGSPALQADSLVSEPQGRSLGSFWGDGNVWYLDSDDGFTDIYFCQNSSWTLFNGYS